MHEGESSLANIGTLEAKMDAAKAIAADVAAATDAAVKKQKHVHVPVEEGEIVPPNPNAAFRSHDVDMNQG